MRRSFRLLATPSAFLLALSCLALLTVACTELSPTEKIEAQRQLYSAELTNFVVMQEPAPEPDMESMDGEPMADEPMDGDMMDDDMMDALEPEPMMPMMRNVLLDILVQNTGATSLPGITVDINQVDGAKSPKGSWKVFLELPSLAHGSSEQVSHVLEDVDFVEGDGFHVEVRGPIPAAEQGDYAEFQP